MGETVTDGFAVPHAKDAAIKDAAVFIKEQHPLEWPSFDEAVDVPLHCLFQMERLALIKLLSKTMDSS